MFSIYNTSQAVAISLIRWGLSMILLVVSLLPPRFERGPGKTVAGYTVVSDQINVGTLCSKRDCLIGVD
jgi:hypothetical protein